MTVDWLPDRIEALYALPPGDLPPDAADVVSELRRRLSAGDARAAEPRDGGWVVNEWVKKGILLGFRAGTVTSFSVEPTLSFYDKDTFPLRQFTSADGVRVVPGGSSIRDGAYIGQGVVCMPPMFVNVGAYVGEGSMIDSHALVGSCAQVGRRVHLSAAAQVGGVLEPIGALPVIIEDDVLVGGNCGVYEGAQVGTRAVLAPGTILTRATALYDLVNETVIRASTHHPLRVPPNAVVVPGSRPVSSEWGRREGLQAYAPVIVKYRDAGTDAAVALEEALR